MDDEEGEPEGAFVEDAVEKLLLLVGLPVPEALTAVDDDLE